jgi:hypothetical protein
MYIIHRHINLPLPHLTLGLSSLLYTIRRIGIAVSVHTDLARPLTGNLLVFKCSTGVCPLWGVAIRRFLIRDTTLRMLFG